MLFFRFQHFRLATLENRLPGYLVFFPKVYQQAQLVFRREISRFDKGLGSLLCGSDVERNRELYKILNEAIRNVDSYLEALLFFIKENYAKIPIVVLDNCDKRNKGEQLLMFEVAQWLRAQYKCIVILPMRDATYDTYKSEPPLDTVVRDLVFRIDPPDLLRVLQARLDYITRITEQSSNTYILENGMRVAVKRSELIEYFQYIGITALFGYSCDIVKSSLKHSQ